MFKKVIIANWKMNPTSLKEAKDLFSSIARKNNFKKSEVVICPPNLYLTELTKSKKISLGAQNLFYEERGAFTGEVSALMLADLGVKYVILGHSERRKLGETDEQVNKKIKSALFFGLRPIVCIGEVERDEGHNYFDIVKNQIKECLDGIKKELISKMIMVYEPVWAISTTANSKKATPADAREMVVFFRKILVDKFGRKTKMPKIIYGGSVDNKNCADFLKQNEIDGVLVGVASLNTEKFLEIVKNAENA